ncbi:hypothetical protein [Candidatus Chloroploca mongolica]|nr:hypothetical protein [Candidatus Chloroploca mongolica]
MTMLSSWRDRGGVSVKLRAALRAWPQAAPRPLVLLIDEIVI